jgi:hypothetical protein
VRVKRHVSLSYRLDSKVCDQLCDTTFTLKLVQAVKLKRGAISAHARGSIGLDCTAHGDHTRCASISKQQAGTTGGTLNGGAGTGSSCNPAVPGMPSGASASCASCLQTACAVDSCFGAGWTQGDFSGSPCNQYFACIHKCQCNDTKCIQGCLSSYTPACKSCAPTVNTCINSNCGAECGKGSSGTAGTGADVTATCGDGIRQAAEACDGSDLSGASCAMLGYKSGVLMCDPLTCMFDTSMCGSIDGSAGTGAKLDAGMSMGTGGAGG